MRQIEVHPLAAGDAEDAARYYLETSPDVAQDFVRALEVSMKLIIESPDTWPRVEDNVRRRKVDGFPHWVVYQVRGDVLLIFAVAHPSRRPGY